MLRTTLILLAVMAAVGGLLGLGGCRDRAHHRGAEFMLDYLSETLDLSADQQEALEQIKTEMFAQIRQMRAQREAHHGELMAQLRAEEMDAARLKELIAQHRAQMDALMDLGVERLVAFHRTLSPEQKEKLAAKIEKFHSWHGPGFD